MNENKFNDLVKKLEQIKEPQRTHSFNSDTITHTYNTSYNNTNIQIILNEYSTHSTYDVLFSNKNDKNLFSLSFFELNNFNDPTRFLINEHTDYKNYKNNKNYKYSGLTIDNIEVKDQVVVHKLLQKVDFDGFVQKEIIHTQQIIDANKQNELLVQKQHEQQIIERQQQLTNEVLAKTGVFVSLNTDNMQDILKKTDDLNNSKAFFYFFNKGNYDSNIVSYMNEHMHHGKFEGFSVEHKVINFMNYESKTHVINFIDTNKNIDVFLEVTHRPALKYHQTEDSSYHIHINNERISEPVLISKIIKSLGIDGYLDKSLQEIRVYEQAKQVKTEITSFINKKITESKADEIFKILDNSSEPLVIFDLSKMPIDVSGAKIWLNKENKLHRDDGPAVENYQGKEYWFKDGKPYIPEGRQEYYYSKDTARIYENGMLVASPNNELNKPSFEKAPVINKEKSLSLMQRMKKKLFSSDESEHKNTRDNNI